MNRRRFFEDSIAALAVLGASSAFPLHALESSLEQAASSAPNGTAAQSFFNDFYAPVAQRQSRSGEQSEQGRGGVVERIEGVVAPVLVDPNRETHFIQCGPQGMRHAENISDQELADIPDNVAATFTLGGFELGPSDSEKTNKGNQLALKLDCSQIRPLLDVLAPLTWVGLASAMPDNVGKLPSLQDLKFHSTSTMSEAEHVVYTGGRGKLALNVWSSRPNASILKVFGIALKGMQTAAQVIPLPAISIPAAVIFTQVVGRLYDHPIFILNQGLTDVVASRDALGDRDLPSSYLRLVAGDYILIQKPFAEQFGRVMDQLTTLQGYVVEKGKHEELPVERRAEYARKDLFPNVTYAVLKVAIGPATPAPAATPAKPSSASSSSSSKSQAKPSQQGAGAERRPIKPLTEGSSLPDQGAEKRKPPER